MKLEIDYLFGVSLDTVGGFGETASGTVGHLVAS